MKTQRLEKLEKTAAARRPKESPAPFNIYVKEIGLDGSEKWDGLSPAPGEDPGSFLEIDVVETKPDELGRTV